MKLTIFNTVIHFKYIVLSICLPSYRTDYRKYSFPPEDYTRLEQTSRFSTSTSRHPSPAHPYFASLFPSSQHHRHQQIHPSTVYSKLPWPIYLQVLAGPFLASIRHSCLLCQLCLEHCFETVHASKGDTVHSRGGAASKIIFYRMIFPLFINSYFKWLD